MSWFEEAFALYRRHFAPLLLTAALSLVPANVVMVGAVVFGLSSLGAGNAVGEAKTDSQQVHEKQRDLREHPAAPERQTEKVKQVAREAVEGGSAFDSPLFRMVVPLAYSVVIIVALLLAGLFLAHAALVPLVVDRRAGGAMGPAGAWAAVASRIGALLWTGLLAAALVAVGTLFCVVPGIAVATGCSFAIPVALTEGLSGRAALERSWRLMRGSWVPVLAMWLLIVAATLLASGASALVPPGLAKMGVSALIRVVAYPLPLVGLILLYLRARDGERAAGLPIAELSPPA